MKRTCFQQLLGYILIFLSVSHGRGAKPRANTFSVENIEKTCRSASTSLSENSILQDTFFWMHNSFAETRLFQQDPVEVDTIYLYNRMKGDRFDRMEEICENEFHYDMCFVTSQTDFFSVINGVPVRTQITEFQKPLCMPKSCSDDQALLIDPNPAKCFPEMSDCSLTYYEISCPPRNITDTTFCVMDAIPQISPYNINLGLIEGSIITGCGTIAAGGSSRFCAIDYGTFSITTEKDFSERENSDQYANFEQECLMFSGQICNANIEANYTVPNGLAGDVLLTKRYNDFPFCVPIDCTSEADKKALVFEQFIPISDDSLIGECDVNAGACNLTISIVSCHGAMFSASPSAQPPISIALDEMTSETTVQVQQISSASQYSIQKAANFVYISIISGMFLLAQ